MSLGGRRFGAFILVGISLASTLWSTSANASCIFQTPQLLWSYPTDGSTDIPTNVDLWVTGASGDATLNGAALTRNEYGAYDLGQLSPSTTYTVHIPAVSDSITFTTGTGPSSMAPPSANDTIVVTRLSQPSPCPEVPAQACFDTGPPSRVRFDAGDAALGWIVEGMNCDATGHTMFWPAECGAPVVETESYLPPCVRLRATDGVNVSDATELYCSLPVLPEGTTLAKRSNCSDPWPPADAVVLTGPDDVPASKETAVGPPAPSTIDDQPPPRLVGIDQTAPARSTKTSCSLAVTHPGAPAPLGALVPLVVWLAFILRQGRGESRS